MKPVRFPRDPAQAVKDSLAAALAPTAVRMSLPDNYTPTSSATQVVVFDDGGPAAWPAATNPRIRVTVFAHGRTAARTVAAQAMSHVLSVFIDGVVLSDPTAILEARDPTNGADLASFTVSALARTLAG